MKTLEEFNDGTRILWDYTPQELRASKYPNADMMKYQSTIPRSIRGDSRYCQTYRLLDSTGYDIGVKLTEIP